MDIVRIVLDAVLALLLLATGGGKLAGAASSHAIRDSLLVPAGRWKVIGGLEVAGVVGLLVGIWVPLTALAATIGVVALMAGAAVTRRRAGETRSAGMMADAVIGAIGIVAAILNAQAI